MKKQIELRLRNHIMRGYENKTSKSNCVILFHGYTGNKMETNKMFLHISEVLESEGISSLRFDWFGHGESDLNFSEITVDLLLEQAKSILDYATENYDNIYLVGFSMGGYIALNLLDERVKKLILISPALNMKEIVERNFNDFENIDESTVDLNGLILSHKFVKSFGDFTFDRRLTKYKKPVLILHGTKDLAVPFSGSEKISRIIKNCRFISVEDADHGYGKIKYKQLLTREIMVFIKP